LALWGILNLKSEMLKSEISNLLIRNPHSAIRNRLIACRRRLRQTRVMQRAMAEQAEVSGQLADGDLSGLACGAHAVETEGMLSHAEASTRQRGRTLMAEVDRRPTLRAR
jgi:hypothetical protein